MAWRGLRAGGGEPEDIAHGGEGAADVAEIIAGMAIGRRAPALPDRIEHALKLVRQCGPVSRPGRRVAAGGVAAGVPLAAYLGGRRGWGCCRRLRCGAGFC